jgi:lipoprotein NlpI
MNAAKAILGILLATQPVFADSTNQVDDLLTRARNAYNIGKKDEALSLVNEATKAAPKDARAWFARARLHEANQQLTNAVADYDQVLRLDPRLASALQQRGEVHFKLGRIKESLADFDKYLESMPQQKPQHWQRGITLYYAEKFSEGRKQFELHQTVNPNDVENAVWHFLCVARESNLEKARAAIIPIKGDTRVPMKEIHSLFAGKLKPEDVLKAAGNDQPTTARKEHLFYAHLYLGLYFEAIGDAKTSAEHIKQAAQNHTIAGYMGDVARVHQQLRLAKN